MFSWIKSFFSQTSESAQRMKQYILVVDDSEVERTFYRQTLQKAGYEVFAASNALTVIDSLKNRKPDLIISDLSMPDMDGKEMCRCIKANDETENIPVIFLTGKAKNGEVVDCFDAGGEYFLEKPIDAKTLVRQVQTILSDLAQEVLLD